MGYYKMSYVYYFVPHTLLSGLMFYYFTSFSYVYLVIAWCGVPLFISFIPELMILVSFFKFSFLNFVLFFFVLCKFCWRSMLSSYSGFNFVNLGYIFYGVSFFYFGFFSNIVQ